VRWTKTGSPSAKTAAMNIEVNDGLHAWVSQKERSNVGMAANQYPDEWM
jgi:hypothetical protein